MWLPVSASGFFPPTDWMDSPAGLGLFLLFFIFCLPAQGTVCVRWGCTGPSVTSATQGSSTSAAPAVGPVSATTTPTTAIHSPVSPVVPTDRPTLIITSSNCWWWFRIYDVVSPNTAETQEYQILRKQVKNCEYEVRFNAVRKWLCVFLYNRCKHLMSDDKPERFLHHQIQSLEFI